MSLSPATPQSHQAVQLERLGAPRDIAQLLMPLRRAMGLGRIARGALLGFAAGAAVGAFVLLAARIRGFDLALTLAIAAASLGVVAGLSLRPSRPRYDCSGATYLGDSSSPSSEAGCREPH
jgi:hypothetical protein